MATITNAEFTVVLEGLQRLRDELKLSDPKLGSVGLGCFIKAAMEDGMSLAKILQHVEYTYDRHVLEEAKRAPN